MLEWALRYIALGWPVFPCTGKKPLIKQCQKGASLSEKQVREWWRKWPRANAGLLCGVRFFVVDIDAHRGGDEICPVAKTAFAGKKGRFTHSWCWVTIGEQIMVISRIFHTFGADQGAGYYKILGWIG